MAVRHFLEGGVIAEIGINHDGVLSQARELILGLGMSGVHSVKLQYRNLNRIWTGMTPELGDEILQREITKSFLSPHDLCELRDLAHSLDLRVGISFFHSEDLADFDSELLKFDFMKVPSVELTNQILIDELISTEKLVLISTGGHSEEEIFDNLARIADHNNWWPLHAVMNYPCAPHNAQLGFIRQLAKFAERPVGYSSHDVDWETCVVAVCNGATFVERHVTLDRTAEGLDHSSSSTPSEVGRLQQVLLSIPHLVGNGRGREVNQGELMNRQNLGRSLYAKRNLVAGDPLSMRDFVYRSPQKGLDFSTVQSLEGKALEIDLNKGDPLDERHLTGYQWPNCWPEILNAMEKLQIAIPVRPHDHLDFGDRFGRMGMEFHLSFNDLENLPDPADLNTDRHYSVHLPDYESSTRLLDPFSSNPNLRNSSLSLIEKAVDFALNIQDRCGRPVPVVGSFSVTQETSDSFYLRVRHLSEKFANREALLLAQWLPPYAWYFGGSIPVGTFNSQHALEIAKELGIGICLDVSHFSMGLEAGLLEWKVETQHALDAVTRHLHISGSWGLDGEGAPLQKLIPRYEPLLRWALRKEQMKVLECWQGHLKGGLAFAEECLWLSNYWRS